MNNHEVTEGGSALHKITTEFPNFVRGRSFLVQEGGRAEIEKKFFLHLAPPKTVVGTHDPPKILRRETWPPQKFSVRTLINSEISVF